VSVRRAGENFVVIENRQPNRFPAAGVTAVTAMMGAGNDRVLLGRNLGVLHLVSGDAGDDVLVAGNEAARLAGGAGNDRLVGGPGNDRLDDAEGNNLLVGGAGDDEINGGTGDDRIFGGAGNDRLYADGLAFTGGTNNFVSGGAGNDTLLGSSGADRLDGGAGDDLLDGGTNNDVLAGGAGNDRLVDPQGRNVARGGAGWDAVRMIPGDSRISGADVVEHSVSPTGTAAPTAASIAFNTSADGIRSATVTLTLPEGNHDVVWATPGDVLSEGRMALSIGVSLRPAADPANPAAPNSSRTFELHPSHQALVVVDAIGGLALARQDLDPLPAPPPGPGPIPLKTTDVDVRMRRTAGGVEAHVVLEIPTTNAVTFGTMTRVGDEFFVDIAAAQLPPVADMPPLPMEQTFTLGALGPGTYAVTVRSRTGVVETQYFDIPAR
jgi:hypothetical protein